MHKRKLESTAAQPDVPAPKRSKKGKKKPAASAPVAELRPDDFVRVIPIPKNSEVCTGQDIYWARRRGTIQLASAPPAKR